MFWKTERGLLEIKAIQRFSCKECFITSLGSGLIVAIVSLVRSGSLYESAVSFNRPIAASSLSK